MLPPAENVGSGAEVVVRTARAACDNALIYPQRAVMYLGQQLLGDPPRGERARAPL